MAIATSTSDNLEYQFYPCSSGQLQFRVKAANDAHIALTSGPNEGEPMFEVFIGGWSNEKSVIRKNRTKPEVAEVYTPNILSADEFRGFWIKWNDGGITVGKEGESQAFLVHYDPDPLNISYFGVCTGWGATGEWILEGRKNLKTADDLKYQFHPAQFGAVALEVKAPSNAHIALTRGKGESSPMYEIMLGGWENSASVIRYDRKQPDKVRVNTPNLLSPNEHKRFSISWLDGHIVVRSGDQRGPVLMEWKDPNPIGISHIGVRTGWGATGNWKLQFEHHQALSDTAPPLEPEDYTGGGCWRDATGDMVPPDAVEGGRDLDQPLYVGRAEYNGVLIPGKINLSHAQCYIAWGGKEHSNANYQVLCGCNPRWVKNSGGNIPPKAIPGGKTEDGEPLYIGRVEHEGTLTIGKVQPSHNVLYISFNGDEIAFPDYEILIAE